MSYGTASITSATPVKDLMAALNPLLTTAGYTFVETVQSVGAPYSAIAYGNGVFVTVASGTAVAATSTDGITWTARALPVSASWSSVTYGNSTFVAVATGGTTIAATSPDGVTWTQRAMPVSSNWTCATYGNGTFVAMGSSTVAATSPDGATWTQRVSLATNFAAVTYGNSLFVAVSNNSTGGTSPDGVTWTSRTLPAFSYSSVTYGNGVFVAVSTTGLTVAATSPDGTTWTQRVLPSAPWTSVTYANSVFVAVSTTTSSVAATSPDGVTWTQRALPTAQSWTAVAYATSLFVTVSAGGTAGIATSADGVTWTSRVAALYAAQPTADVYKSPAGSNAFGSDWYLILRRLTDTDLKLWYQVAEAYNATTHRITSYGSVGATVTPVAVTYANPGAAVAPDVAGAFGASANVSINTAGFTYWYSMNTNRFVLGLKVVAAELAIYWGLYDDLLPLAVSQFPLVACQPTIGSQNTLGGFTREPLQAAASAANFSGICTGLPFATPTLSSAIYGNAYSLSRVPLGSNRNPGTDGHRGLMRSDCVMSYVPSVIGDTLTAGGKTYTRFGGLAATAVNGFFVDQAV